jgi:hypothetical protein
LPNHAQRTNRSGNQDVVLCGFPRLARDLYAAMIELCNAIFQAKRGKFVAVRSKRIGFDDVSARLEVGHVNAKYIFRAGGVQFVHATLRSKRLMEQRSHRPIGDQY